jgi:hypothetical protein
MRIAPAGSVCNLYSIAPQLRDRCHFLTQITRTIAAFASVEVPFAAT